MSLRSPESYSSTASFHSVAVFGEISQTKAARLLPEMSLVAAVLEDAVRCIHKNQHARRGRPRREFLDACRWVFDSERTWPFAFENVCDILGLSAAAVRHSVGEALGSAARSMSQRVAA